MDSPKFTSVGRFTIGSAGSVDTAGPLQQFKANKERTIITTDEKSIFFIAL